MLEPFVMSVPVILFILELVLVNHFETAVISHFVCGIRIHV